MTVSTPSHDVSHAAPPSPPAAAGPPPRVLLVDDSLPVRQRMGQLIRESGLAQVVGETGSVAGAIDLLGSLRPDALVLDLQLSDGSGYAVLEAARRDLPGCRIVVITSFAEPETRERCLALDADHVLEKSSEFEQLPGLLAGQPPAAAGAGHSAPPALPAEDYRHLFETVDAPLYTCDAQGYIRHYNAAAVALWGREPVLGQDRWVGWHCLFETDGRPLAIEDSPMAQTLRERRAVQGREVVAERPDGTRVHVLPHPKPLFDAAGRLTGAVNLLVDVTSVRDAQQARRHDQLQARRTLDSLHAQVCVLDERGRIVATNRVWRDFACANGGLPDGSGEGIDYLAVCDAAAAAGSPGAADFAAGLRDVLGGARDSFELEYPCHAPGNERWFSARVTPLADSVPRAAVVSHLDISARKKAEAALQESEHRFKFAVEGAGDGLWDRDLVTDRTVFSPRWKAMLGYAEHEIGDSPQEWLSRVHPDDLAAAQAASQACRSGRQPSYAVEIRMRCKDGRWKWVLNRGTVVNRAADGTALRMIGTHSDISARKSAEAARAELEAQLRESQKLEAVGTLAGSIAHDFNNIMGSVLGHVALALEGLPEDDARRGHLEQIRRAGLRARGLVRSILAVGRRQAQAAQVQPLAPLLHEAVELLTAMVPAGVAVQTRFAAEPLCVEVDASQLGQVLLALGTNAWHALQGRGGLIEIGLEPGTLAGDGLSEAPGPAPVAVAHLWVRDSGVGMDEATRARIFEPFFTTQPAGRGTGLGLAMVQRIVRAHGGAVRVDSKPGGGSCFHIYLPLATEAPAAPPVPPAAPAPADVQGRRVLYIDDDQTMSLMVQVLVRRAGLRVTCLEDAEQAIATLRADPSAFDVVVTDFHMPRCSGLDVARAVAALPRALPVILATGDLTDELLADARAAGVDAVLRKECTYEDLGREIFRVLSTHAQRKDTP
jgi:PAS domain S-box-containing protein